MTEWNRFQYKLQLLLSAFALVTALYFANPRLHAAILVLINLRPPEISSKRTHTGPKPKIFIFNQFNRVTALLHLSLKCLLIFCPFFTCRPRTSVTLLTVLRLYIAIMCSPKLSPFPIERGSFIFRAADGGEKVGGGSASKCLYTRAITRMTRKVGAVENAQARGCQGEEEHA